MERSDSPRGDGPGGSSAESWERGLRAEAEAKARLTPEEFAEWTARHTGYLVSVKEITDRALQAMRDSLGGYQMLYGEKDNIRKPVRFL